MPNTNIYVPNNVHPRFNWQVLSRFLKHEQQEIKEENKSPEQKGHEEAEKDIVKDSEKNQSKLNDLLEKAGKILFEASAVWPFDFFPNKIIIDTHKMNIIFYEFFLSRRFHSISIKDISDIIVDTGPFFAVIKIVDAGFTENSIELRFFKKKDALKIRRLVQGLAIASKHEIDLSKVDTEALIEKIEELGSSNDYHS